MQHKKSLVLEKIFLFFKKKALANFNKFFFFFQDFRGKLIRVLVINKLKFLKLFSYTSLICLVAKIPIYGIDYKGLFKVIAASQNGLFVQTFLNYASFSPFDDYYLNPLSLGILPYVNASLFVDLLIKNVPSLEKFLKDEGPAANEKVKFYKKIASLFFGSFYVFLLYSILKDYLYYKTASYIIFFASQLLSGCLILIWVSDRIDSLSIVNGISFLLCINLIKNIQTILPDSFDLKYFSFLIFFAFLIYLQQNAKYPINVISSRQFAYFDNLKRNKKTGIVYENLDFLEKISSYRNLSQSKIFLRVNPGGIYPLIISSSILSFFSSVVPVTIKNIVGSTSGVLFYPFYFLLLIFSCYSYSYLYFDPSKIREEFLKNSIYIRGVEPGEATEKFLIQIALINSIISGVYLSTILSIFQIFKFLASKNTANLLNLSSIIIFIGVISEIQTNLSLVKINIENAKIYESSIFSKKNL